MSEEIQLNTPTELKAFMSEHVLSDVKWRVLLIKDIDSLINDDEDKLSFQLFANGKFLMNLSKPLRVHLLDIELVRTLFLKNLRWHNILKITCNLKKKCTPMSPKDLMKH